MEKTSNITCIMCPMGCNLEVVQNGEDIKVSGNTCKRGEVYGKAEVSAPIRMVTSTAKYKNGVTSVKTASPIPKEKVFEVLGEIKALHIKETVDCGDIVIKNTAETGVDIVVTGNMK